MRKLLALCCLGLVYASSAYAGDPIVLPDFTPQGSADVRAVQGLQQAAISALNRNGHLVLTNHVVTPFAGSMAGCAEVPNCPFSQLQSLPARFAVVVKVRDVGGRLFADLELYEKSSQQPIERRSVEVPDAGGVRLGLEVADMVSELASVMGPADASYVVSAARMIANADAGDPAPQPSPAASSGSSSQPTPSARPGTPIGRAPVPLGAPTTKEERMARVFVETDLQERHFVGVRDHFLDRKYEVRDWMYRYTPHAGRAIIEIRAGLGIGDVDRVAYVRTHFSQGQELQWFQEGPAPSQRVRGEVFAGYAPSAWFDVGVLFGLQYGQRRLDSGWSDEDGNASAPAEPAQVQAAQFHLQPRLRFYPLRTGPVKPYVVGGLDFRFFDQWRIVQPPNFSYAEPPGGFTVGPAGALGLLIDPSPLVGLFLEGCYVMPMGARGKHVQYQSANRPSDTSFIDASQAGYLITATAGVQFRL